MQMHGLLDTLPLWALFVATLVIALLSFEGGFWGGKRRSLRSEREQEVVGGGLVEGMLGLAAFMLAFTFGAAATHFDARRQAIIDEANAIREAYLRADFLPEPHRAEPTIFCASTLTVKWKAVGRGRSNRRLRGRRNCTTSSGFRRAPQEKRPQPLNLPQKSLSR